MLHLKELHIIIYDHFIKYKYDIYFLALLIIRAKFYFILKVDKLLLLCYDYSSSLHLHANTEG